ncbi:hypothetical protein LENED_003288 [Lentinula edodes]|uniref:Uncharacterized protein n=1 Tax=Lentinula edodes TaxID=5353 RepID=A0A1Q3E375_LENED|nr:hypothetical protein LENED_003288 [Lentinula edodes]
MAQHCFSFCSFVHWLVSGFDPPNLRHPPPGCIVHFDTEHRMVCCIVDGTSSVGYLYRMGYAKWVNGVIV